MVIGVREAAVWSALQEVADPEIPAISVVELGVIGAVRFEGSTLCVELLPTFVGCPAIEMMRVAIEERLRPLADEVRVELSFAQAWSSDRITPAGREHLRRSGFAPPPIGPSAAGDPLEELTMLQSVSCPHCGSRNTTLENAFGPTLCRAIYHCADCRQPFEQFKPV